MGKVYFRAIAILLVTAIQILSPTSAQSETVISDLEASHLFGHSITFTAGMQSDLEVRTANLTFRPGDHATSQVIPAAVLPDGLLSAEYLLKPQDRIPAFSNIEYWFTVELMDGSRIESSKAVFQYADNRFDWQTIEVEGRYFVHWIEGDLAFGQSIVDVVLNARTSLDLYLDLPFPPLINLYIYPTAQDLNTALGLTEITWVSGHAVQGETSILVALPSGFDQQLDARRIIPHEIAHLRLEQYLQDEIVNLPFWYSEGLASLAEEFTPPEYWEILQSAGQAGQLIPLDQLCQSFPSETGSAGLAYAQSESFVRYLHNRFGKVGLQALLNAYLQGESCTAGTLNALGVPLEELEADWVRATFNRALLPASFSDALPWLTLLVILLGLPLVMVGSNLRRTK